MMIHVFNPEHDLALAHNGEHFTAPHAARELRMNLGFIPALWAADGDIVLVDDVEFALKASRKFKDRLADVLFMSADDLRQLRPKCDGASVWGWDRAVRRQLLEAGVAEENLPDEHQISVIRSLSGRQTAVRVLGALGKALDVNAIVGRSVCCSSMAEVEHTIAQWGAVVLKAPWSSSGRGIKYVMNGLTDTQRGWCAHVLHQQGTVVVELYNNKVIDFGMEFRAHDDGSISYEGLSMFQTQNGAYIGNVLDTEEHKLEMLSRYLPLAFIEQTKSELIVQLEKEICGKYVGCLGVDMMVVTHDGESEAQSTEKGFRLNPCVEINLRRTMGHVALALSPQPTEPRQLMRIIHGVNYELKLSPMENNFVKLL